MDNEIIRKKAVQRVIKSRLESGFSQAELAAAIGKPTAYIVNLEKATIAPRYPFCLQSAPF